MPSIIAFFLKRQRSDDKGSRETRKGYREQIVAVVLMYDCVEARFAYAKKSTVLAQQTNRSKARTSFRFRIMEAI